MIYYNYCYNNYINCVHLCVLSYLRITRMAGYLYILVTLGVPTNLVNAYWPDCTDSYITDWRPDSATQSTEEGCHFWTCMGMAVTGKIKKTEQNRQILRACCRPRKPVARIQSRGDPSCTGKPWTDCGPEETPHACQHLRWQNHERHAKRRTMCSRLDHKETHD